MSDKSSHLLHFQGFPVKETIIRLGIQSTNAMGCGLRVYGTPCRPNWEHGGEETSFVSVTPGTHGYFGHCLCSAKFSLPRQGNELCRVKSCKIVAFHSQERPPQTGSEVKFAMARSGVGNDPHTGHLQVDTGSARTTEDLLLFIRKDGAGDGTEVGFRYSNLWKPMPAGHCACVSMAPGAPSQLAI